MSLIRKAQVAGTFYPANRVELKADLENMLAEQQDMSIGTLYGIIAPHAGYIYSGKVAAKAYKQIEKQNYETVIVISPSHHDYFEGCSIFSGNYETPLGQIQANKSMIDDLSQSEIINNSNLGHQNEHALEVHLPFLQLLAPNFKLIPIVMGIQDFETAEKLANTIFNLLRDSQYENQKVLIVSSSDLSHFYNVKKANLLDREIINDIESFDIQKLNNDILYKKTEACGFGPILAGMMACRLLGATNSKVLAYGTSADVNKDLEKVVGYLSAAFYKN